MLTRHIEEDVQKYLDSDEKRILFIWGPRRSGKTTLLQKISAKLNLPIFNFDFISDQEKFSPERDVLQKLAESLPVILIDEVQNFPESTRALKILHDEFGVKIIATGSSELRKKAGKDFDSLSGRYLERFCLPLSVEEIIRNSQPKEYELEGFANQIREKLMIFGAYPEIYDNQGSEANKTERLSNIVETYVLKDVINIFKLKNAKLAKEILTKVALQLGSEVSLREIANSLQANVQTVSNYIEIFIKNYVLIQLPAFKTNARRAISENRKLYFYDLGIRNALVNDFRPVELRPDSGGLFENFIVSEMEKRRKNEHLKTQMYFYREYNGKEVDLVLVDDHKNYICHEIGINKVKAKKVFPLEHVLKMINAKNYWQELAP